MVNSRDYGVHMLESVGKVAVCLWDVGGSHLEMVSDLAPRGCQSSSSTPLEQVETVASVGQQVSQGHRHGAGGVHLVFVSLFFAVLFASKSG